MSNIDERVVAMKFDNAQFGTGVKQTLDQLASLKAGLKLDGATAGIDDVGKAVGKFSAAPMTDQIDNVKSHIDVMRIFAVSAIYTISSQLVHMAENVAKSLTIAPITAGLDSYSDTINATQTILANTQAQGVDLKQVTAVLADLQLYANKTVYSFADMTKNISLFTAAGVSLKDSTAAIKGISNLAAMSGVDSEHASGAMFQLSQAISSGTVKLQDWNSVMQAGLGGQTFQKALIQTAKVHGVNVDAMIKKQGSFRESLTDGWLTSQVLTETLDQFTGDLSDAQLKSMGYTQKQIADIQKLGKTALDSAVNIRTIPQMMQALKEEVATAWGSVFKVVFGDIDQATSLFTKLHNVVENAITGPIYALRDLLQGWADLGGRAKAIDAFSNAFKFLGAILKPIHDAFREIFPATTANTLFEITTAIDNFTKKLTVSGSTANNIKRTFAGFFAVLDIGWQLLKAGIHFIADLVGHFSQGSGGIMKFTGNIGDLLVRIDQAIKSGDIFGKFFDRLAVLVEKPIDGLKHLISFIASFVGGMVSMKGANSVVDEVQGGFAKLGDAGDKISRAWDRVAIIFTAIGHALKPVLSSIGDGIKHIASGIADFLKGISFGDIIAGTGIVAFTALVLKIRKTINNLFNGKKDAKPGIFDKVKESLEQLTGTLKSMQQMLKAATLLEIAAAIAILTIAVSVLSKIDAAGLALATAAISTMLIQLTGTMVVMDKMMKKAKGLKMDLIAAGMILVAIAVDILASAVKKMADLSWNDLSKGLTGVIVLLGGVVATLRLMPDSAKTIKSGVGIIILAEGIKILVDSVKSLAKMSWADMAKGLTGVAALLVSLDLFNKFNSSDSGGLKQGLGLVLLATGVKILAGAVADISKLSWVEIAKGMTGIAGGLVAIVLALKLMPDKSLLNAAAILVTAQALGKIGDAIKQMGQLSWGEIAKGGVTLAGALVAIALALKMMPKSSALSALGLLITAQALGKVADVLADLAKMSWGEIAKSLVELAGALLIISVGVDSMETGVIGAAALVVVAQALKVLAGAMVIMGGMTWSSIAKSLVELAAALLVITIALEGIEVGIVGAAALIVVAQGLKVLAQVMVTLGAMSWSDIGAALGGLAGLFAVLAVGGIASPLIGALAIALGLLAGAIAIFASAIKNIGSGIKDVTDSLERLSNMDPQQIANMKDALKAVASAIPDFIKGIAQGIVDAAQTIADGASAFGDAAAALTDQFVRTVTESMPKAVAAFVDGVTSMLTSVAEKMPDMVQSGGDIVVNFLEGLATQVTRIASAGTDAVVAFLQGIADSGQRIIDAGFKMIVDLMNGLADSIRKNAGQMRDAAKNIGSAIIDGITGGLNENKGKATSTMGSIAGGLISISKKALNINSPSKEFIKIGQSVIEGFVMGIKDNRKAVDDTVSALTDQLQSAMDASSKDADDAASKLADLTQKRNDDNAAIRQATLDLNDAMRAKKRNANTIRDDQERIRKLTETRDADNAAIRDEQAALAEANDERARSGNLLNFINQGMNGQIALLQSLADGYDGLTTSIDAATKALDDATKARDDYNNNVTTQYDSLPDIGSDTTLIDFEQNLQNQIRQTQNLTADLEQLRQMGLNDTLYKDLVAKGTGALPFVENLIGAGQATVEMVNGLSDQLDQAAQALGGNAAKELYQVGVDTAQGLLDGLQANQDSIKQQMTDLANTMTQEMRDRLGIHSPSTVMAEVGDYVTKGLVQGMIAGIPAVTAAAQQVAQAALAAAMAQLGIASPSKEFAKLGQWSSEGMANGLAGYSSVVSDAAANVGSDALNAMRKSITGLGDLISGDMDMNPVITPVLDLSNVKMGAAGIGSLLSTAPISVDATYSTAKNASAGYAQNQSDSVDAQPATVTNNVNLVQNNNSPKALSSATIYRQTKNQLSVAKGALTGVK